MKFLLSLALLAAVPSFSEAACEFCPNGLGNGTASVVPEGSPFSCQQIFDAAADIPDAQCADTQLAEFICCPLAANATKVCGLCGDPTVTYENKFFPQDVSDPGPQSCAEIAAIIESVPRASSCAGISAGVNELYDFSSFCECPGVEALSTYDCEVCPEGKEINETALIPGTTLTCEQGNDFVQYVRTEAECKNDIAIPPVIDACCKNETGSIDEKGGGGKNETGGGKNNTTTSSSSKVTIPFIGIAAAAVVSTLFA